MLSIETQHNRIIISDSFKKAYMAHQKHSRKELSYSIQAGAR